MRAGRLPHFTEDKSVDKQFSRPHLPSGQTVSSSLPSQLSVITRLPVTFDKPLHSMLQSHPFQPPPSSGCISYFLSFVSSLPFSWLTPQTCLGQGVGIWLLLFVSVCSGQVEYIHHSWTSGAESGTIQNSRLQLTSILAPPGPGLGQCVKGPLTHRPLFWCPHLPPNTPMLPSAKPILYDLSLAM